MTVGESDLRFSHTPEGVAFWIHVSPRSRRPGVGGSHGDALRVAVSEPPVEGAANTACVQALAGAFGVRAPAVELEPGAKGRRKRVRIAGDGNALATRLDQLAAGKFTQ